MQLALDSILELFDDPSTHRTVRVIKSLHMFFSLASSSSSEIEDDKDLSAWIRKKYGLSSAYKINRYKHYYYSSALCILFKLEHLLFGLCAWGSVQKNRALGMLRNGQTANIVAALLTSAESDHSKINQAFIDKYLKRKLNH